MADPDQLIDDVKYRTNAATPLAVLSVAEVATMLRVSKMTVYRLVKLGELPAVRVGRSFRIWRSGVYELLKREKVVAE